MAQFEPAVEKTLKFEGGYSNDINDAGGPTNFGITLKVLQGLGKQGDLDGDGDVDIEDIKFMSKQDAINVYRELYWRGDDIGSQAIAEKNFDMGVNIGVVTAAKLLQKAILQMGHEIEIDGHLGSKSLELINSLDEAALMTQLCTLQENYYWSITLSNIEKKASTIYKWPEPIIKDAILACQTKNLTLARLVVNQLSKLKMVQGNISFIGGWVRRANDRFGV